MMAGFGSERLLKLMLKLVITPQNVFILFVPCKVEVFTICCFVHACLLIV